MWRWFGLLYTEIGIAIYLFCTIKYIHKHMHIHLFVHVHMCVLMYIYNYMHTHTHTCLYKTSVPNLKKNSCHLKWPLSKILSGWDWLSAHHVACYGPPTYTSTRSLTAGCQCNYILFLLHVTHPHLRSDTLPSLDALSLCSQHCPAFCIIISSRWCWQLFEES